MTSLTDLVICRRWWVVAAWLALTVAGIVAAPHAVANLSQQFDLPGRSGYEANQQLTGALGTGGSDAPVVVVLHRSAAAVPDTAGTATIEAMTAAAPRARTTSFTDQPDLRSTDGRTAAVLVYPRAPGATPEPYAQVLPALRAATQRLGTRLAGQGVEVRLTGQNAVSGSEGGDTSVLVETLFGALGALVVLLLVFGSFLALTPLLVAGSSILTTFVLLWGVSETTQVSAVVEFLLALIGLGVAIDYALLIVTRWREEGGRGHDPDEALRRAMSTAGRSVLFSGITVAVSLAALIALPVPFLRSIGFTGLLIPLVSVAAALTLLPATLSLAGRRLAWPNRRGTDSRSRLWHGVGRFVVRRRWICAGAASVLLLALAAPVLGIRLGAATNDSVAGQDAAAGTALRQLQTADLGAGLTQPVEVLTDDPAAAVSRLTALDGVAGAAAPSEWRGGGSRVVDVWTTADASSPDGQRAAARIRTVGQQMGDRVGGAPAENADYVQAVYGHAWWIALIIAAVTFVLLAAALRSWVLPVKAILLNVLSLAAALGLTVLIWQHGVLTTVLFDQQPTGAITVWVPIGVFAFLFGLSMDYEVFLLSRIREEHDAGADTDRSTVDGVARTGRLVTSGALILFLAFVSLSRIPSTEVRIFATALALGIALDATVVRGVLAPALVAALGRANWAFPARWRGAGGHASERDRRAAAAQSRIAGSS